MVKKSELPKSLTSVNENNINSQNSSKLIERDNLEGTPFMVIGNQEQGYFLCMGKSRLSEILPTKEAVIDYLNNNTWNVAGAMMIAMIQDTKGISILAEAIKKDEEQDMPM